MVGPGASVWPAWGIDSGGSVRADVEVVKVAVGPAEGALDLPVQVVKGAILDLDSSALSGLDAQDHL